MKNSILTLTLLMAMVTPALAQKTQDIPKGAQLELSRNLTVPAGQQSVIVSYGNEVASLKTKESVCKITLKEVSAQTRVLEARNLKVSKAHYGHNPFENRNGAVIHLDDAAVEKVSCYSYSESLSDFKTFDKVLKTNFMQLGN